MILGDNIKNEEIKRDLKYLTLLSKHYPTINEASTEIINLQAILNLPKGTEHFYQMFTVNMNNLYMCLKMHQVL